MKKLFTVTFVAVLAVCLNAQTFKFEWQNPKPQGNELNKVISFDANNFIAFGYSGLVQSSTDGGSTYTISYPDTSHRDIAAAYFWDSNKGIACGTAGLIMKTSDKGKTWTTLTSGTTEDLKDIKFIDADTGYAVGTKGTILKTKDGGKTWTGSVYGTSSIYKITIVNPALIYLGTGNTTGKLSVSTDCGVSWKAAAATVITSSPYSLCFLDATTGFAGSYDGNIFKTTDGGTTWTKKTISNPSGAVLNDMGFVSATEGYAVDDKGYIYKTTDAGENWTGTRIPQLKFNSISIKNNTIYCVGTSGSIMKSTNSGANWDSKIQSACSVGLRQITFIDSKNGFACGGSSVASDSLGYMYKTTDGGATWTNFPYNFKTSLYSYSMPTQDIWYAVGGANSLFKTIDAGKTWEKQTSPVTGVATMVFYSVIFTSKDTGYACGNAGKVIKTVDGGKNWTNLTSGFSSSQAVWKMALPDSSAPNTLYICGLGGKLSKTTDGGATWNSVDAKIAGTFFALKFKDSKLGLLGGTSQALAKTTDGGNTWTPVVLPMGVTGTIWAVGFGQNTYWIGIGNGDILYSLDNGASWKVVDKFNSNIIYDIAYSNKNVFFSGNTGAIIKSNADPSTSVKKEYESVKSFELVQNYPNPFNPTTTIKYSVPADGNVTLKVYNVLGKEVATLINQNQSAGSYSVNFNASELSSGIYFYQLTSGSSVSIKKMMLLK